MPTRLEVSAPNRKWIVETADGLHELWRTSKIGGTLRGANSCV